jgi:hypothetical protein
VELMNVRLVTEGVRSVTRKNYSHPYPYEQTHSLIGRSFAPPEKRLHSG